MSPVTWAQRYLPFRIWTMGTRGSDSEHWRSNRPACSNSGRPVRSQIHVLPWSKFQNEDMSVFSSLSLSIWGLSPKLITLRLVEKFCVHCPNYKRNFIIPVLYLYMIVFKVLVPSAASTQQTNRKFWKYDNFLKNFSIWTKNFKKRVIQSSINADWGLISW